MQRFKFLGGGVRNWDIDLLVDEKIISHIRDTCKWICNVYCTFISWSMLAK